ncbi:hypothetical protein CRG98_047364 [Punica granatum]|uniref:Uncharacterized protein n=1 Tax=Punica granatum TaxID=22663 RepID=A0A2I0HKR7_PUNGR|nr:hypothetical protein CRG98_047364 [Punica granatum]
MQASVLGSPTGVGSSPVPGPHKPDAPTCSGFSTHMASPSSSLTLRSTRDPSITVQTCSASNIVTYLAMPRLFQLGLIPPQGWGWVPPLQATCQRRTLVAKHGLTNKPLTRSSTSVQEAVLMNEKEVSERAWGLANSKQPFLGAVQPGSVQGLDRLEWLLEGFWQGVGERGHIVKWAPQKAVLADKEVGGFLSHSGVELDPGEHC